MGIWDTTGFFRQQKPGFKADSPFGKAVKEAGLDTPESGADAYDDFRKKYFDSRVAPRLKGSELDRQRETFMDRTKRPSLPLARHLNILGGIALDEAAGTIERTASSLSTIAGYVAPGAPSLLSKATNKPDPFKWTSERLRGLAEDAERNKEAQRQTLRHAGATGGKVAAFGGGVAGYALETAAGGRILKPLAALPEYVAVAKAFPKLFPAAVRSVSFATLNALDAEPGKRTSGFATGLGWGVFGELVGAGLGRLFTRGQKASPKEIDELIKGIAVGEIPDIPLAHDLDHAIAEELIEAQKSPGYLAKVETIVDEKFPRPHVSFVDEKGNLSTSALTTSNAEKAYAQVKEAIDSGRMLARIEHDGMDTGFVNELLAKLREGYEPWSATPTQIATDAIGRERIDVGKGVAKIEGRTLQYRYAKAAPTREEARRFIKGSVSKEGGTARVDSLMHDFDTVWNGFANWMQRSESAARLEALGVTDIIPTPEVRARWRPSEGMNLPKIFNERGWYDTLDRWKGMTEKGEEVQLDLRQKEHLTNAMKTVWDPRVPSNSAGFRSALRALAQYDLRNFFPGDLTLDEVGALLNESRAGTETAAKARSALEKARTETQTTTREHLYQQVARLSEVFAKDRNIDTTKYVQQYGRSTVDAATQMAGMMWERAGGDLLEAKWDEELLKQGIREGVLPPIDPSGKPLVPWLKGTGQEAIDDVSSLRRASQDSLVLRLAEQYNVDPKNIDRELLEEVGESGVAQAKEIVDAARKRNVSVYDQSVLEEMARLGKFADDSEVFAPRSLPPSELPSKLPGEPSGVAGRKVRLGEGAIGNVAYNIRRAGSGLPSRIYVMFDDAIAKRLEWSGTHGFGGQIVRKLQKEGAVFAGVVDDLKRIAALNGADLNSLPLTLVRQASAAFDKRLSASTLWHEDLHGLLTQMSLGTEVSRSLATKGFRVGVMGGLQESLPKELEATWRDLAKDLNKRFGGLYKESVLPEEAFVHAASAVRFGDTAELVKFAKADTSVARVYQTVQAIARELRTQAATMAPGTSKNFAMDRLGFLETISGSDRYKAIRETAELAFSSIHDPSQLVTKDGLKTFELTARLFDEIEGNLQGQLYAPNYTAMAEMAGVRHAMYPTQMPPGKLPPPMPETGIEDGWLPIGVAQLWEKIAPTLTWANWIDKRLNEKWSAKGTYMPIADRVRAVTEAYRAGDTWLNENRKSALEFLRVGKGKLESFGYLLTKEPKQWNAEMQRMGLTNEDLVAFKQAHAWMTNFQADTHVPVFDYFLKQQPGLASRGFDFEAFYGKADPGKMAIFQRLIANGDLNPRDLHLGRLINVFLREGMEQKFTGQALKELRQVINKQTDGKYILGDLRVPLQRFHDYMKGIPDNNGKMLTRFASDMGAGVNKGIERVNQHLPKPFQVPKVEWGNMFGRMILLNYVGNIGGRAAIAIRDSAQVFVTGGPIVGFQTLARGMVRAIDPKVWEMATKAGVPLKGRNMEDMFGDIFQELPVGKNYFDRGLAVASQLLAPSRWGHNVARRVQFAGVYDKAATAVEVFRKGDNFSEMAFDSAEARKFFKSSSLWFADEARRKQLLSLVQDKYVPTEEVAKQVGLEMNDLTLWAYRRGTQPGFLKTGVGRIFGQYGLWPMNYIDYVRRLAARIPEYPEKALPALAMFAVVNYELVTQAREHLGVDVSRWFGLSPMGYAGSPHLQFGLDVAKGIGGDRQARKRALEYPTQFVPASNELRTLQQVWGEPMLDDEGHLTPEAWKALGFKIYKPNGPTLEQLIEGDVDFTKYIDYEMGGNK